jgi:hypothetical protein
LLACLLACLLGVGTSQKELHRKSNESLKGHPLLLFVPLALLLFLLLPLPFSMLLAWPLSMLPFFCPLLCY